MTFFQPPDRGPEWFRDVDGIWTKEKSYEDTDVDVQDWSDRLKGLTIVSAVCTTDGITINSSSNTSTTTTVNVSSLGVLHWDITKSDGSTERTYFRWRRLQRPQMGTYGGGNTMPGEDYR